MICQGTQPSPYFAARRIAGLVFPPIQIGGCGFATGRGSKTMSSNSTYLPWYSGRSSVHRTLIASRYSSLIGPRSARGTLRTSNSFSKCPMPMPRIERPPEEKVERRHLLGEK